MRVDGGCTRGDPALTVLPWVHGEGLSMLGGRNHSSRPLALYETRQVPAQCAIVVDRHVHKNGGSTMRDWFLEHERQGDGLYLGYKHAHWTELYSALRQAARSASPTTSRILLIESHYGRVELAEPVLPSLRELSLLYSSRGIACPLVLVTRVREPLEYYLSFYRWGVGFRQRDNPGAYGATFLEWVERVPNLQSTMMVQSMAS